MLSRTRFVCAGGIVSLAVVGVSATSAVAGPDWVEAGDAGSTIFDAQFPVRPIGVLELNSIAGVLADAVGQPDYEDLYFIRVVDPGSFSLSVAFADFDAVLYMFNLTVNNELYGLLGNDNMNEETNLPGMASMATDGTGVVITRPGDYVIAVTGAGRAPVSRSGPIFNLGSPTEVSGADGNGGFNPLSGWTGTGERGRYRLTMESTDFPITPAPGAGVLLGAGMLASFARRRR